MDLSYAADEDWEAKNGDVILMTSREHSLM